MTLTQLRSLIEEHKLADEHSLVNQLIFTKCLDTERRQAAVKNSSDLVIKCRQDKSNQDLLDSFLLEFGLSNSEGVGLMCLAEALLRVPDALTADRLIAEKIQSGDWVSHTGQSDSLFVNAATWGLVLTGKVVNLDPEITENPASWVKQLSSSLGEPVIRTAVFQAMKIMGGQYVLGQTIDESMKRGQKWRSHDECFSFDMLGEGARSDQDAIRYFNSYAHAIEQIGQANSHGDVYQANGISVKLSALHCKYHVSHYQTVMDELLPRITELCQLAKKYNIGLSIDAEEAERLDISLDIFESLATNPNLDDWQGLGFVLQAYQKRAPFVAKWLIKLGQQTNRKIIVRLVKGAYWDSEIKLAQEQGLKDYPVYTRKANTDISYLHCADLLLKAENDIYPQFATHNAYTACMLLELSKGREIEFQRLHGMGNLLYNHLFDQYPDQKIRLRIYAPIGAHEDLLPYLVRRLLENGANSSFVNRFLNKKMPVNELVKDIYTEVSEVFPYEHKAIPRPENIYQAAGEQRKNAKGIDLTANTDIARLTQVIDAAKQKSYVVGSIVGGVKQTECDPDAQSTTTALENPADHSQSLGYVISADESVVSQALINASEASGKWSNIDISERAALLYKTAQLLESHQDELIGLISIEGGRTIADAVSEVREAVDFCRYYALKAQDILDQNTSLTACGTFFCISPWNFPLAIFVGQIAAALATGNSVIAKPAAQTPLIACRAVELFHQAGIPVDVLQLLVGSGSKIGGLLIPDPRISGICFTGSTETAQHINQQLAKRSGPTIPFIAETGGQNCMLVDSSALPEQVVDDVISSSFQSAGQRCSALRVMFLQDDIADKLLHLLDGAMQSVVLGNPGNIATDVGPIIDDAAKQELIAHVSKMEKVCRYSAQVPMPENLPETLAEGNFFAPRIYEIDSLGQLDREVFGPILHVIRYNSKDLDQVIEQINNTGYGLTLGIHSRIESFANYIFRNTSVGNTYINRNTIGAVVGVNPFGGMNLSGTGPKAGGPNYLYRFCSAKSRYSGDDLPLFELASLTDQADLKKPMELALNAGKNWAMLSPEVRSTALKNIDPNGNLGDNLDQFYRSLTSLANERLGHTISLPGPTGEENLLFTHSKGVVACLAKESDSVTDIGLQLGLALTTGCTVVLIAEEFAHQRIQPLLGRFDQQELTKGCIQLQPIKNLNAVLENPRICGLITTGDRFNLSPLKQLLAARDGAITPLIEVPGKIFPRDLGVLYGLMTYLFDEKTRTENLVARGGNTQLFNLTE